MIRLLAQPGDIVACEAPAYYATLEMLGDTGIRVLPIPVRNSQGVDLDLVATLFERYHPKFFVVCSTLSNPSGATMPNNARRALVEICRKSNTQTVEGAPQEPQSGCQVPPKRPGSVQLSFWTVMSSAG